MVSGRDTTLQGAQVSGEKVKAEVGRNLTLATATTRSSRAPARAAALPSAR